MANIFVKFDRRTVQIDLDVLFRLGTWPDLVLNDDYKFCLISDYAIENLATIRSFYGWTLNRLY